MNDLRERLEELAEDNYREFSKKLTPTKYPILGVRTPKVREFAKSVPVGEIENYLRLKPKTFEDVLLRGFLIGRLPYKEMLEWFDSQVEYIDNWATCDMFCSALRSAIKKQLPEFLDLKVKKLLEDKHEFTIRVGLVLLKAYYVETNNLAWIFEEVEKLASREGYYIRMAIAWLISECFIKYPAATTGYLVSSSLPKWTFNKTISKICDSYRVDAEEKKLLRKMRK